MDPSLNIHYSSAYCALRSTVVVRLVVFEVEVEVKPVVVVLLEGIVDVLEVLNVADFVVVDTFTVVEVRVRLLGELFVVELRGVGVTAPVLIVETPALLEDVVVAPGFVVDDFVALEVVVVAARRCSPALVTVTVTGLYLCRQRL